MSLLEKVKRLRTHYDRKVHNALPTYYDQNSADKRELMEEIQRELMLRESQNVANPNH